MLGCARHAEGARLCRVSAVWAAKKVRSTRGRLHWRHRQPSWQPPLRSRPLPLLLPVYISASNRVFVCVCMYLHGLGIRLGTKWWAATAQQDNTTTLKRTWEKWAVRRIARHDAGRGAGLREGFMLQRCVAASWGGGGARPRCKIAARQVPLPRSPAVTGQRSDAEPWSGWGSQNWAASVEPLSAVVLLRP